MINVWEQLVCQTCGSNAVEIVDGLLCCKACKSKHTLQEKISEEEVIALNRAASYRNRLASDDAFDEYTELLKKYPDNEAANWGAFLSFYGIVYEKDTDGKYIPTCHRLSEKPVESSAYYYHFGAAHKAQAEEIEKLRVAIMDKAKKIQPYDVFICYKATEERFGTSMPTKEAAWARDVYDMLTHDLKLRVFFAEKSLQGSNIEYEPHIYSALNSAKLMLVLTTGIENVNATWVKNEWKRFSHYIKEGQDKTIRVVYDGIQPYDLPQELQKTQAIDHNAMGWDKAVRQAAESIFAVKEEKPEWQKAMEEMQAKMRASAESGKVVIADKYCVKCGVGNVKTAKFCADCGGSVFAPEFKQYCKNCGQEMALLKKHCTKCGCEDFVYTKEDYQKEVARKERERIAEEERKKRESLAAAELARQEAEKKEKARIAAEAQAQAQKKKRTLITTIIVLLIIAILGNMAGCLYARSQRGWCDYELSGDGGYYVVKNGNNITSKTTIFEEYEGKPVKEIADNALGFSLFMKEVVIPDGITRIGEAAFVDCWALESVIIPDSVERIEKTAFDACYKLSSVTIGSGVNYIGEKAFDKCNKLTSIVYCGTMDQWNAIYKVENWRGARDDFTAMFVFGGGASPLKKVVCTDGTISL